ncbi:hypothetical protein T11_9943 [Trichinella zimbabwensis]|uniref:Uncharacterized protein n=1 Tax=Trichinella zimbabwensis TaxID=268475 RepID=A0A0V1F4B3_9BILA|nr:hypothetical protein T11_9943 [Trichinella zimbabwensis]
MGGNCEEEKRGRGKRGEESGMGEDRRDVQRKSQMPRKQELPRTPQGWH